MKLDIMIWKYKKIEIDTMVFIHNFIIWNNISVFSIS